MAQNEEVLKKCAQEYLARVKQEEQRYQTLKVHAEEKLDKCVVGGDREEGWGPARDGSDGARPAGPTRRSHRCVRRPIPTARR